MGFASAMLLVAAAVPVQPVLPPAGHSGAALSVGATVVRPETVATPGLIRAGGSVLVPRAEGVRVVVEGGSVRRTAEGGVLVTPGRAERITITLIY